MKVLYYYWQKRAGRHLKCTIDYRLIAINWAPPIKSNQMIQELTFHKQCNLVVPFHTKPCNQRQDQYILTVLHGVIQHCTTRFHCSCKQTLRLIYTNSVNRSIFLHS
jgi:hypothetical protein